MYEPRAATLTLTERTKSTLFTVNSPGFASDSVASTTMSLKRNTCSVLADP
jgi:hypothetical protein